jgi:O-antigen/teichoic acid export membrane protein
MFEKIKELTRDTAIYGISTIVGRFFNFLLVPFYTNVFSTSEYGIAFLIYSYLAFLNIVYIYGMDAAFMKYSSTAENDDKADMFSTPFLIVTLTSVVFTAGIIGFRDTLGQSMNIPESYSYILLIIGIILILDTVTLIPFANLRLERKASKFAIIKTLNIVINLSSNLILILIFNFGIEAIFISNLIASAFSFIALLPEIISRLKFRIKKEIAVKMLKFGLPYLPASFASMVVQLIDTPILDRLTNQATVGIYKANYKLGIFMMLFVSMFNYAWQPFFLNNAKEDNAKEIFSRVLTLFLIVSSFLWLILSLFIEDIATIKVWGEKTLIGQDYIGGLFIVPIILLGYLFYGLYINFTAGIYIEEKTKYFPYVTGLGAVINIVVNFTLIPVYGITGAALATLASYFCMAVGLYIVSQKFYKIDYEYRKIISLILLLTLTIIALYYIHLNFGLILIHKIIIFAVFVAAVFLLRVINLSELRNTAVLIFKGKK